MQFYASNYSEGIFMYMKLYADAEKYLYNHHDDYIILLDIKI